MKRGVVEMRYFIGSLIVILLYSLPLQVNATSYEKIDPEEVVDRAEVIVIGSYDFNRRSEVSEFVFDGHPFKVDAVLRGDVGEEITAGIDRFDVSWAKDFQDEGGRFMLLLENIPEADFLTPVVAANGMVQLQGEVVKEDGKDKDFYTELLKENPPQTKQSPKSEESASFTSVLFLVGVFNIGGVFFLRRRSHWAGRL
ncbi:hypothetical protein LC065_18005 [Halobacillus litoralis]|uniref:hypothetical protein n=1 Tax=Halobacillus litoralis TaxID=45668 RepID=UPI001CFF4C99|nr:hypothetical protein [Halobacillus litoralis]WLR47385.1 hypothetical protein LC065_18005 [Halobacillus litoralis]